MPTYTRDNNFNLARLFGAILPNTEMLCERIMQFPIGALVSDDHVSRIGEVLQTISKLAPEVQKALKG